MLAVDVSGCATQERERVKQEGGRWDQERVNGYLEISRAFGNVDLSHRHFFSKRTLKVSMR